MSTALIIIAHGSRSAVSNDEVRALCEKLASSSSAGCVLPAFLELAEPSLSDTVAAAVADGADRLMVLPYFLNSGRHVTRDVPALVASAIEQHPDVSIQLLPHIGGSDAFFQAMESIIRAL